MKKSVYALLFLFSTNLSFVLFSQEISSDVVGSAGESRTTSFGSISWTLGEVCIETYQVNTINFTQGFHQPLPARKPTSTTLFIPEGFSPNNDQINDVFVIRGIENYPNNHIQIYDRWGILVYEMNAYANQWDGKTTKANTFHSNELPLSTYFYLLDLGDSSPILTGYIYLNH